MSKSLIELFNKINDFFLTRTYKEASYLKKHEAPRPSEEDSIEIIRSAMSSQKKSGFTSLPHLTHEEELRKFTSAGRNFLKLEAERIVSDFDGDLEEFHPRHHLTPLQFACFIGDTYSVEALFNKGALPETKNELGETAKDIALRYDRKEVGEFVDALAKFKAGEIDADALDLARDNAASAEDKKSLEIHKNAEAAVAAGRSPAAVAAGGSPTAAVAETLLSATNARVV